MDTTALRDAITLLAGDGHHEVAERLEHVVQGMEAAEAVAFQSDICRCGRAKFLEEQNEKLNNALAELHNAQPPKVEAIRTVSAASSIAVADESFSRLKEGTYTLNEQPAKVPEAPRFESADALATWLEGLHRMDPDGSVWGSKWEPAQIAAKAVRDSLTASPALEGGWVKVEDLDKAFNEEILRVSEMEYNSNRICRTFFRRLRERLTPTEGE